MPDLITGEYLINRALTHRDYHHMKALPGKICDVITIRGGVCEAKHYEEVSANDEENIDENGNNLPSQSSAINMFKDPRIYFKDESFSRYYHDVNLQFAPQLARLARSVDLLTICYSDDGNVNNGKNDDLLSVQDYYHPHFNDAYKSLGGEAQNMTNMTTNILKTPKLKSSRNNNNKRVRDGVKIGPSVNFNGKHVVVSYFDMTIHDNEPYVHFGWKDPLLSVYSNTNNDGEDKKNSQINKSKRKFNKLTLYPKFSYHFEPRKRYTFIRPLQWFLHNIVKTIKPHRETNCERWEEGDRISRENMMGNNYFVEMNAMN